MAKDERAVASNTIDNRETWLRAATNTLRPMFDKAGLPLPESIRFAIAFTSTGRKGKNLGETWHSPASADGSYEIMIRADVSEPYDVLAVLVRQLVHAALPAREDSGRLYKAAATKIGLQGKMREAVPGGLLADRLSALARDMPPLPHARLDIDWKAIDKPKKGGGKMLKAECHGGHNRETNQHDDACGYTIRLSPKWRKVGAECPLHGRINLPDPEADEGEENHESGGEQAPHE